MNNLSTVASKGHILFYLFFFTCDLAATLLLPSCDLAATFLLLSFDLLLSCDLAATFLLLADLLLSCDLAATLLPCVLSPKKVAGKSQLSSK